MPHINELKDSKYLKKEDAGKGILLTVQSCVQENLAMQGQPPDMKWVLYFNETDKGMVLNPTNGQLIAQFLGEHTDLWIGRQIVLYNDPTIQFQGRLTGGIRVRAPRGPQPSQMHGQPVGYQQPPPVQHQQPQQPYPSHLLPSQQHAPPPGPLQPYNPPPVHPASRPEPNPPPEQPYTPGSEAGPADDDVPF